MTISKVTDQLREAQRRLCAGEIDLQVGRAPDVMTAVELATFLGITKNSLSVNLWRYDIPHKRLGRRLLFPRAHIHLWLTSTIEGRVWIDPYRNPNVTEDYWVREKIAPPLPSSSGST
jgi:hypothetical protein